MKKNVDITMPCYSEHILPVPRSILISRFYCRLKNFILVLIFACSTYMYFVECRIANKYTVLELNNFERMYM